MALAGDRLREWLAIPHQDHAENSWRLNMNKREKTVLYAYCQVARKIMRPFLGPNSCVAATRLTIDCLKRYGIVARPQPFKMALEIKDVKRAYTSGLTQEELESAAGLIHCPWGQGFKGHVCAIWEDVLIDPSLDQANDALGVEFVPHRVMLWPIAGALPDGFKLEMSVTSDDGMPAKLTYVTSEDYSFLESEAWNDAALPILTDLVSVAADKYIRELRKRKIKIPA
jgi:hypothetical protein